MAKVERIEYYDSCPSCGAGGSGNVCAYCGTSMIKKRIFQDIPDENIEDVFFREDASLPVEKGKLCTKNTGTFLFSFLFGGIFLFVPTVLFVIFTAVGMLQFWLIPFFGIFWVIGGCAFIPVIQSSANRKKCENGQILTGIVRGYENGLYMINERPVKVMKVRIENGNAPKIVKISTGSTNKQYPVGAKIEMRNYNQYYMIK